MKQEEVKLSDKRECSCCGTKKQCEYGDANYKYLEEDVKEFIKELKSKRNNGDFVHVRDIDKLSGFEDE